MKKRILIALITLTTCSAFGQLTDNVVHLYGRYSMGSVQNVGYSNFSFNAEFFVNPYIGLNYNFDYQLRQDNIRHIHTPMGILGGPILLGVGLANAFDGDSTSRGIVGIVGGLILLALPDGVSFHYSPAYNWDLSPYANVLGLDFIKNRTTGDTYFKYACSFGVKTTYYLNHLTFSAFAETRQAAGFGWGLGGGVGIGYAFVER